MTIVKWDTLQAPSNHEANELFKLGMQYSQNAVDTAGKTWNDLMTSANKQNTARIKNEINKLALTDFAGNTEQAQNNLLALNNYIDSVATSTGNNLDRAELVKYFDERSKELMGRELTALEGKNSALNLAKDQYAFNRATYNDTVANASMVIGDLESQKQAILDTDDAITKANKEEHNKQINQRIAGLLQPDGIFGSLSNPIGLSSIGRGIQDYQYGQAVKQADLQGKIINNNFTLTKNNIAWGLHPVQLRQADANVNLTIAQTNATQAEANYTAGVKTDNTNADTWYKYNGGNNSDNSSNSRSAKEIREALKERNLEGLYDPDVGEINVPKMQNYFNTLAGTVKNSIYNPTGKSYSTYLNDPQTVNNIKFAIKGGEVNYDLLRDLETVFKNAEKNGTPLSEDEKITMHQYLVSGRFNAFDGIDFNRTWFGGHVDFLTDKVNRARLEYKAQKEKEFDVAMRKVFSDNFEKFNGILTREAVIASGGVPQSLLRYVADSDKASEEFINQILPARHPNAGANKDTAQANDVIKSKQEREKKEKEVKNTSTTAPQKATETKTSSKDSKGFPTNGSTLDQLEWAITNPTHQSAKAFARMAYKQGWLEERLPAGYKYNKQTGEIVNTKAPKEVPKSYKQASEVLGFPSRIPYK